MFVKETVDSDDSEEDFFQNPLKHLKRKRDSVGFLVPKTLLSQAPSIVKKGRPSESDDVDDIIGSYDDENEDVVQKLLKQKKRKSDVDQSKEVDDILCNSDFRLCTSKNDDGEDEVEVLSSSTSSQHSVCSEICVLEDCDEVIYVSDEENPSTASFCTVQINDNNAGTNKIVSLNMNDNFGKLADIYAASWGCSTKCVRFSAKNGECLEAQMTPAELNFAPDAVNTIFALKVEDLDPDNLISLKFLVADQKPFTKEFMKSTEFGEIKRLIAKDLGVNESTIRLAFDSEYIENSETPIALELENNDCIDVFSS